MSYWHSICPFCEQGRLFVRKRASDELLLLCEECGAFWPDPESVSSTPGSGNKDRTSPVDGADLARAGWDKYSFIYVSD
jgi:hypothetical protein